MLHNKSGHKDIIVNATKRISKHMKQNLAELKGERHKSTIKTTDFNGTL